MGIEIERKFLLKNSDWKNETILSSTPYRQAYLLRSADKTIRVRVAGGKGFITIKGKSAGLAQPEYEYEIPLQDASELMTMCEGLVISKVRHVVAKGNHRWEVDVFEKENAGLVMAEIELEEEHESFEKPQWLGEEVTGDKRYSNAALSREPYSNWKN